MLDLSIFDVSAFVYQGASSESFNNRFFYNYPIGGIHYLMRYLTPALMDRDSVILAFDSRDNFRKQLMPDYKAGRVLNKTVITQIDTLFNELSGCGFSCYKVDGYEGDDIISWACNQNFDKFSKITIYGNDRDLLHNVRGKISFHSINSGVNSVAESNFSYAVEKGKNIPFNTISFNKVLCGCISDKVPAFVSEKGYKGQELFDIYLHAFQVKELPFAYEYTTNILLFLKIMEATGVLTTNDISELQKRIKIIFPAENPEDIEIIPDDIKSINKDLFSYFLTKYNDMTSIRCMQYKKMTLVAEDIDELRKKAYDLSSGAVAVDKEISVHDVDAIGQCLFMKEF